MLQPAKHSDAPLSHPTGYLPNPHQSGAQIKDWGQGYRNCINLCRFTWIQNLQEHPTVWYLDEKQNAINSLVVSAKALIPWEG